MEKKIPVLTCTHEHTRVVDSNKYRYKGPAIKRRRECKTCGARFNTYEVTENDYKALVKLKEHLKASQSS